MEQPATATGGKTWFKGGNMRGRLGGGGVISGDIWGG